MNRARFRLGIILLIATLLSGCGAPAVQTRPEPDYWPTEDWRAALPEQQGMDSAILAQMVDTIQQEQLPLHSLLIVRNGYLVSEIYPYPYTADQVHIVQSVTKSVLGALVGIAMQQGYLQDIHKPVFSLLSDENILNLDEKKKAVTLENLLSMTAGFDCTDDPSLGKPVMFASDNWVEFMLNSPMVSVPGEKFNYCTGEAHLLSAILQKATGMETRSFANQVLFSKLGIEPRMEALWPSDMQGVTFGGHDLSLTPRQMAKFGYLFLNQGKWEGKTIIPSQWVKASTTSHSQGDGEKGYGYLWWTDPQGEWYAALGRNGQHIFVYPKENMVVVFTAALPTGNNADLIPLQKLLDQYILPAVKSDQPLPANDDAQARLQDGIQALAHPQTASPTIPASAIEISGKTFVLDENPLGMQTLVFSVKEGESEATVLVNGQPITVGLDNLFRFTSDAESPFSFGYRGSWEADGAFNVESIMVGTPVYNRTRVQFSGDTIHVTQRDGLSGSVTEIQGRLSDEG